MALAVAIPSVLGPSSADHMIWYLDWPESVTSERFAFIEAAPSKSVLKPSNFQGLKHTNKRLCICAGWKCRERNFLIVSAFANRVAHANHTAHGQQLTLTYNWTPSPSCDPFPDFWIAMSPQHFRQVVSGTREMMPCFHQVGAHSSAPTAPSIWKHMLMRHKHDHFLGRVVRSTKACPDRGKSWAPWFPKKIGGAPKILGIYVDVQYCAIISWNSPWPMTSSTNTEKHSLWPLSPLISMPHPTGKLENVQPCDPTRHGHQPPRPGGCWFCSTLWWVCPCLIHLQGELPGPGVPQVADFPPWRVKSI